MHAKPSRQRLLAGVRHRRAPEDRGSCGRRTARRPPPGRTSSGPSCSARPPGGDGRALRRADLSPMELLASFGFSDARREADRIDEDKATKAVAEAMGLPYVKIDPLKLDVQLITRTLSRPFARKHAVLPLEKRNGALVVATANPFDRELFENLHGLTGMAIEPVLSAPADIHRAIAEIYGFREQIQRGPDPGGRRGRRRRQPGAVRQPVRPGRARGLQRAHRGRGRVPLPLRLRAAGQRHPRRAAAGRDHHPHADRRGPPPGLPHPQGRARRHRQPAQDHEPARHRRAQAPGRAHPHRAGRDRDGAARLHHPHRLRRQDRGAHPRPASTGARPLRAGVPPRRAGPLRALAGAPARPGGGHRPHRIGQDHHALLGAGGAGLARDQHRDHRGPHRDGARGVQPDRGQPQDRHRLRRGAAPRAAAGPRRDHGGRGPRRARPPPRRCRRP